MRQLALLFCMLAALRFGVVPSFGAESEEKPYTVENGKVDQKTYNGWRRYTESCMRCHGPDGMGSTYAPALMESMKRLSYTDFYAVVAGGKKDVSASQELVMPANGENKNVMCFIDAIYIYLRARADDAVGRGRPARHEQKPEAFTKAEDECMS